MASKSTSPAKRAGTRKRSRTTSNTTLERSMGITRTTSGAPARKRVRPSRAKQDVDGPPPPAIVVQGEALRLTPGTAKLAARELADTQRKLERQVAETERMDGALQLHLADAAQRSQDRSHQRIVDDRAKPCPFCGATPAIETWVGGPLTKRRIICDNYNGCQVQPGITGDTTREALERWNQRAPNADHDDAIMEAWGLLCNVSEGDIQKQSDEWLAAFRRFGDTRVSPAASAISTR